MGRRIAFSLLWCNGQTRAYAASLLRSLDNTQLDTNTHTHTPCRTPLKEWSARRSCYLHNTQQTQDANILSSVGLEPQSQQSSGRRTMP